MYSTSTLQDLNNHFTEYSALSENLRVNLLHIFNACISTITMHPLYARSSCSEASFEPEMEEVSDKLKATALHGEEAVSRGKESPKERFSLWVSLQNPKVTRSHVQKALEEAQENKAEDEEEEDDDLEIAADPTASCLRGLDTVRESMVLVNDQKQRGRSREKALKRELKATKKSEAAGREQLREAGETIATLETKIKCAEAARDVLKSH
eukprot:GHVU01173391.1.p1 GENE.GHVU01173391.1~~GHVU01173391.1.p1  ORF type:complete len:210 (-),score=37.15 GHVU01173391.1:267-896(-)